MLLNDLINGSFELLGALALSLNVRRILKDREVKGVDWKATLFFTSWGLWNLWYYPSLDQWFSFVGGVALVAVNAVWLYLTWWYLDGRKRWQRYLLDVNAAGPSAHGLWRLVTKRTR